MRLRDWDRPEPKAGEVEVKLEAIGINPVDTYQRAGSQGYRPELPFVPGIDGAGTVSAIGGGVQRLSVGDRVYLAGGPGGVYAEYCIRREAEVAPLPSSLGFEEGACLWVNYATAFRALAQRGGAESGDRVLIRGATGGVGVAAVQFAKKLGLAVAGSYGSREGERLLAEQGVSERFPHANVPSDAPYDLIIEMLANVNLGSDLSLLAPGGRVLVVGSRGKVEITPRLLMRNEADVRGVLLYGATDAEREQIHQAIADAAGSGHLKPVVQERLSLADAPDAHRRVMRSPSHGKIILIPGG
jgi:NADPH2:quinone reductase